MTLTLSAVENAFQPSREVEDVERFAGRKEAVSDSYFGLISAGTNLAVVGNRGVGKSSLARQVLRIANGDNSLLDRLELPSDETLDYLAIYFACGNSTKDVPDLLTKLLTTSSCLRDWIYEIPKAQKEIQTLAPRLSAGFPGFSASLGGEKSKQVESTPAVPSHDIESVFLNVCLAIAEQGIAKSGLLIVIDEFDQIANPSGAAGLFKSLATNAPGVKFCIVGVAQDVQNLIKEHGSADRLFAGSVIRLPPMPDDELREIIRIAELEIGQAIIFTDDATNELISLAQGHPYMVHLVGKYALRTVYSERRDRVTHDDVSNALRSMAQRAADPVLEGRYKKAIGSSAPREAVLKSLASVVKTDGECWTTDAYKVALDKGVDNASQYVGHLVTEDYGAEIEKIRERYYRFKDSLFAAYVNARPWQYGDGVTKL